MSLPRRQRRLLSGIGEALRHSDPRLTSLLTTFARLNAGADMPGHEKLPGWPVSRARQPRAFPAARLMLSAIAREKRITRSVHCGSPLPPDPIPVPGGSPLPPDPGPRPGRPAHTR